MTAKTALGNAGLHLLGFFPSLDPSLLTADNVTCHQWDIDGAQTTKMPRAPPGFRWSHKGMMGRTVIRGKPLSVAVKAIKLVAWDTYSDQKLHAVKRDICQPLVQLQATLVTLGTAQNPHPAGEAATHRTDPLRKLAHVWGTLARMKYRKMFF